MIPDENKKSFIDELQSLDEGVKKKILIVGSGLVMVVVVYAWAAYVNNVVVSTSKNTDAQVADASGGGVQEQTPSNNNFWQNIESGTANIGNAFKGGFQGLINHFKGPSEYTINPNNQ